MEMILIHPKTSDTSKKILNGVFLQYLQPMDKIVHSRVFKSNITLIVMTITKLSVKCLYLNFY